MWHCEQVCQAGTGICVASLVQEQNSELPISVKSKRWQIVYNMHAHIVLYVMGIVSVLLQHTAQSDDRAFCDLSDMRAAMPCIHASDTCHVHTHT